MKKRFYLCHGGGPAVEFATAAEAVAALWALPDPGSAHIEDEEGEEVTE